MFKAAFLTIIVGVTLIWTAQAKNNDNNSKCKESIEQEIREYVMLDSWQQLFMRHFKFIVNETGDIINEFKRLKFGTIIHNALYGHNHERDDEVDDCPNIYHGSVKSCNHGRNLRSALFRAARCSFTKSSIKHIMLSNVLLKKYPLDKLDMVYEYADKPIRKFRDTIVYMLSVLAHGETGGIGDLMALNLYLNNVFDTVLMYKVKPPVMEQIESLEDFEIAKKHSLNVHNMILDKMYTFWNTWCSDEDILTHYKLMYADRPFEIILEDIDKNRDKAYELINSLNVPHNTDLDFDPDRILLVDYVNGLISNRTMPDALLGELKLNIFEATFEFNPNVLYEKHYKTVFRNIYTVFYWTTITHLKLGVQFIDEIERFEVKNFDMRFTIDFIKFVRPLTVFDINQSNFVMRLSPKATMNINKLVAFLLNLYKDLKNTKIKKPVFLCARLKIQKFVKLLSADMKALLNMEVPSYYYDHMSYDAAVDSMKSNYQVFTRLVAATSVSKDDRRNINKLTKFYYFLSEGIHFKEN